jgi:hypothetical protein
VSPTHDVLIAGGGLAGCAAALASARAGARTLLVERGSYLGGNATRGMVAPWQSYHASRGEYSEPGLPPQVIGGIAQEFVDDLVARGASLGHIVDPIGFAGSLTPVDADELKLYLIGKLQESGVELRLNSSVDKSILSDARFVVDATGCCAAAGLIGADLHWSATPQPLTWMFTMEQVDTTAIRDYQLANRDQFVLHPRVSELRADFVAVSGFFEQVREGRESGALDIPRDRLLFFSTPRAGEVLVNTTRIPAGHPSPRLEGLRQIAQLAAWLPHCIPGFEYSRLGRIADDIGERESARLNGRYSLSLDDLITGKIFDDSIAKGCYPIDIHSATSDDLATRNLGGRGWYDIPVRCLQAPGIDTLLVAGRCISADSAGFASARTLPTAMATGQSAGMLAAAYALNKNIDFFTCLSAVSLV